MLKTHSERCGDVSRMSVVGLLFCQLSKNAAGRKLGQVSANQSICRAMSFRHNLMIMRCAAAFHVARGRCHRFSMLMETA